ncbi:MAG: hypothetical protein IJS90_10240 [Clostridia bacterium]|nr:hypothetical protein [Clostridia bacterium]
MNFKKTIGIILVLSIIFSLCSCFTVEIRVDDVRQESVTAGDQTSETAAPETEAPLPSESETVSEAPSEEASASEETSAAPAGTDSQTEPSSAEPATEAPKTPDKMSKEDLLKFFNASLNRVKEEKVGFKKSKLTSILDLQLSNSAANTLVGFVKGALLSETADETNVGKGESGIDVMSPSGKTYASSLTPDDITSINCTPSGSDYVIKVAVKGETNPVEGGHLSKVFDFMTVDDVVNIYAPKVGATVAKDDIKVVFSDCAATLTVSGDGVVKSYSTYVKGVMNMYNASIKKVVTINTDLAITLASTTDYTGFVY